MLGDAQFGYDYEIGQDAPEAYYRLGETSGTTAADSGPNGHDGTYVNGVTLGSGGALLGSSDTSATLDGNDDRIDLPAAVLDGAEQLTIVLWIRTDSANGRALLSDANSGNDNELLLWLSNANSIRMHTGDATGDGEVDVSDLGILAGNWRVSDESLTYASGDFNGDGEVGVEDFGILAGSWRQQRDPMGPWAGDFTGDGRIDVSDLGVLAGNWSRSLDDVAFASGSGLLSTSEDPVVDALVSMSTSTEASRLADSTSVLSAGPAPVVDVPGGSAGRGAAEVPGGKGLSRARQRFSVGEDETGLADILAGALEPVLRDGGSLLSRSDR